ncbi:MAG: polysaccharide deacetylase family protein [Magnetospirillum sp.]|nr:polysaccharide deacetylase family protein [Magnetospirillum sp.]
MRRISLVAALLLAALVHVQLAHAQVVEHLPTRDKVVALTFDACEGKGKPAWFDHSILTILEAEKLPFTIFATGLFAERNKDELARLALLPQVEIENHSLDHPQHMETLPPAKSVAQVEDADRIIAAITGRKPVFFRFPAGNYDAATLAAVEATGHRVVHWSWASGDPAKGLQPGRLKSWVLDRTRPGDILIFHINGRAPATGQALPDILAELRRRGFRFVRLDEMVK